MLRRRPNVRDSLALGWPASRRQSLPTSGRAFWPIRPRSPLSVTSIANLPHVPWQLGSLEVGNLYYSSVGPPPPKWSGQATGPVVSGGAMHNGRSSRDITND